MSKTFYCRFIYSNWRASLLRVSNGYDATLKLMSMQRMGIFLPDLNIATQIHTETKGVARTDLKSVSYIHNFCIQHFCIHK